MSQNLQIGYQQPQPILTAQQIQQLLNSGVSEQMIIDCLSGNVPINQLIQSNNVNKNKQLLIENDPQLVEESTALALLGQENLHPSRQSTNNVRDYFGHYTTNNNKTSGRRWINNENYYFLCNQVFRRLELVNQNLIQRFYNNTTKTNLVFGADNISKDAYSDSVRGIGVITSSSDGNCFFQAVSQGINHYNMTSNQRIIYGIYGATQQFTQSALRNIVAEYLINILRKASQEQIERIYMGPFNSINELNEMFANQAELYFGRPAVEADFIRMPDRDYIQLCNTVYQNYFSNGGSTFLIKQVTSKPINNRMNPFNFFQANEEQSIIKYINSANYWGDELSIKAIRETLGLNIFIISNRYNANNPRGLEIYRAPEVIPQIYETPQEPRENSDIFDKYMFLYNEANAHYELVTFTYYNKQKNQMQVSIFETNMNIMPALHIIFFLYVHTYLNLTVQQKDGCIFMQQIFHIIDVAVQAIGREFNNETLQNIQNSRPDPNNMMPGKGLNYMGQPETPNCKFMRLIMNLFRPNGDVIYQNPPNMYTQYFLNTWRQYIGQYRYTIWSYPDDNVTYRYIDPNARDGYVKLVPDHNMTQGPPGLDTRARNQLIQKGGQFGQYSQNNYMNPSTGYMNPSTGYMNPSTGYMNPNDQYYQALINLNNAQNLQYLTNDQVKVIMSNFSNLKKTNISYQITIDLELEKGDKLTAISYAAAKCRNKWNKIRKNYSEITGLKYTIPPVYSNLVNNPLTTYSKSGKGYKKEKDKDKDKEKDKEKDDK